MLPTERVPDCPACGTEGRTAHRNLRDRLHGAPGEWSFLRCPACGHLWLSPRATADAIGALYADYHTHRRGPGRTAGRLEFVVADALRAERLGHPRLRPSRAVGLLARLLGALPRVSDRALLPYGGLRTIPGGRFLDVGAGSGELVARMKAVGWDALGVEPDPAAAALSTDVRPGTLEAQRFPDGSFDAVHLSHVLEHVPHPAALLGECRRVLRPGGRLVLLTPNAGGLGHRLQGRRWRGLEVPRHLHVFTARSLRRMLRSAGFERARVRSSSRLAAETWAAGEGARHIPGFGWLEELVRWIDRDAGEELVAESLRSKPLEK